MNVDEEKKIRSEIYLELEHKHQINLQCARKASRDETFEEIENILRKWCCGEPNHSERGCEVCVIERRRLKSLLEELKQRGKD